MKALFRSLLVLNLTLLLTACPFEGSGVFPSIPTVNSKQISASGGELMSGDQRLRLIFPSGALSSATVISITELSDAEILEKYPEFPEVDIIYDLSPDGLSFLEPVQFTFLLPDSADLDIPRTFLTISNGVATALENVVYNPIDGTVTGTLTHFSDILSLPLGVTIDSPQVLDHFVGATLGSIVSTAKSRSVVIRRPVKNPEFSPVESDDDPFVTVSVDEMYVLRESVKIASRTETILSIKTIEDVEFLSIRDARLDIGFSCNDIGVDIIEYQFFYRVREAYKSVAVEGTIDLQTEVTCLGISNPEEEIIPPGLVPTLSVITAGQAPEAVKKAGSPPYADQPENTAQRFITSGLTAMTIFDIAGEVIENIQRFAGSFGALYLQHSSAGDFYLAYGPNGRELCALPDGFCQIDSPAVSNPNTTSVEYGVNANGNQVFNQAYRVRGGSLRHTTEDGAGWQEIEVFNGAAGQMTNTTLPLFAYEPLTPFVGIGITSDGHGYFIDVNADTQTEFSAALGAGLRDIECDQFSAGNYVCAIQSFSDQTITPCGGSSAANFSCGVAVAAGDGVSLGVAINDDGNLVVIGADYTDSSIHALEFNPALGLEFQLEIFYSDWISLYSEVGAVFSLAAHVELDAENDSIILTGNGSSNAAIIPLDALGGLSVFGADSLVTWFQ